MIEDERDDSLDDLLDDILSDTDEDHKDEVDSSFRHCEKDGMRRTTGLETHITTMRIWRRHGICQCDELQLVILLPLDSCVRH